MPLECKQPKNVLLLMKISFLNKYFCYVKALLNLLMY